MQIKMQNENEMKNLEKKVTKNLIKNYSNLLNGNSFKDFSIFVENKSNPFEIKVHKSILSSRSPFFNESLRQESLSISLNQFNKKEMESILKEIIKFIQFKQEKKEIFQFDFFQFLNNWIEKRNQRLKGKKEKEKEKEKGIEKKRLFHSFFSLFDKDSISKQDFDKLKQFDFFPKSFLVDIQNKVIQDNQKENQQMKIEIEEKWKKEIEDKEKENQQMKIEIEDKWKKEIENKEKENQQMKIEIEEKWKKEIEDKNKEIEEKWKKEVEDMKPIFDKYGEQYQKDLEYEKQMKEFGKAFSDSEIIQDIEYVKKLQEWINDNDFFSKMKKGFSAKRDGFNSQNWHKAVDGKGKTLVIIKTKQNFIFGGFTQVGFNGNTGNINDSNAFIFSLRNDKGDRIPAKFTIKTPQYAIYSNYNSCGPYFGNDFYLSSNLQPGYSDFGNSYNLPNGITYGTNEAKSYLAGSYNSWVVDEVETYFI
ncbi:pep-cterm sorting domain-containing protein [Anaeramoeba ignava]|uniref:Pep-cterm sorting domain-containing protein n=1 Tax=Anaeramoeba ignava TaxID=1746090 RepID=A0A9Q0R725_ANAIG|nr:pep-cterm sorting domain-containing protein [Anaeramoeba ignava]